MFTGIVESTVDKVQPFRVWVNQNIVWFAKTKEEAEKVLTSHQLGKGGKSRNVTLCKKTNTGRHQRTMA